MSDSQNRTDSNIPHVIVIDSKVNQYVNSPDIEARVLGAHASVEVLHVGSPGELRGRIERADAVISWHLVPLDGTTLSWMSRCRGIVRAAVGYDNIDLNSAASLGIPVANVPDYGTEEVADHTLTLLLAVVRNIKSTQAAALRGQWDWREIGSVPRLRGSHLGLVGFGRIGSAVARRATAFGMEVSFFDPWLHSGAEKSHGVARFEELEDMLANVDVLSIHTPLNDSTRRLIDARALSKLKVGGIVINTSRGETVDEEALIEALKTGRVAGAGLDVLENEPVVPEALRNHPRVLLTAHSAFYSDASLLELRHKASRCVLNFLFGRPERNIVNAVTNLTSAGRRYGDRLRDG